MFPVKAYADSLFFKFPNKNTKSLQVFLLALYALNMVSGFKRDIFHLCPCVSRALLKTSWRLTEHWLKKSPADTPDRSYRESTICTATWSYTETSKVNRSSHKSPPAKNSGLLLCNVNLKESVTSNTFLLIRRNNTGLVQICVTSFRYCQK